MTLTDRLKAENKMEEFIKKETTSLSKKIQEQVDKIKSAPLEIQIGNSYDGMIITVFSFSFIYELNILFKCSLC